MLNCVRFNLPAFHIGYHFCTKAHNYYLSLVRQPRGWSGVCVRRIGGPNVWFSLFYVFRAVNIKGPSRGGAVTVSLKAWNTPSGKMNILEFLEVMHYLEYKFIKVNISVCLSSNMYMLYGIKTWILSMMHTDKRYNCICLSTFY